MRLFGFLGVPSCPFLGPTAELLRADATYSRTCPGVISLIEIVYACVDAQALDSLFVRGKKYNVLRALELILAIPEPVWNIDAPSSRFTPGRSRIPPSPLVLYPHPSAPSRLATGICSSAFGVPETAHSLRTRNEVGREGGSWRKSAAAEVYDITCLGSGNSAQAFQCLDVGVDGASHSLEIGITEETKMDNAGSTSFLTSNLLSCSLPPHFPALTAPQHHRPLSRISLCPLPDPTSMLSLPSRFTNAQSLFWPSCWRMQAYIDVQPVKSKGATAASVPAEDVQSGTISSPRAHPRPHSSRLRRRTSLRITEDRTEKVVSKTVFRHPLLPLLRPFFPPSRRSPVLGGGVCICAAAGGVPCFLARSLASTGPRPRWSPLLAFRAVLPRLFLLPYCHRITLRSRSYSFPLPPLSLPSASLQHQPVVAVVLQNVNVNQECDLQASCTPPRTECLLEIILYPRPRCIQPDHCVHLLPHLEPASVVPDTSRSRSIAEDGRYPTSLSPRRAQAHRAPS
ncbi:hypothetical protein B0H13DRAFT_2549459 [Mycena leptocephala]|nr:hypothetical protein B0H13DRAFT_2549459 [Mycena leptocephala]